ncbi:MAG: pseudaminic acid cytidylyltransferase [Psychrobium sp.]
MNIAIIPARGGSKRIPRKNIKDFCGKPIIAYSIETALESDLFDKVIVSTDDEEIAEVAREYGAEVPFMRPKELADDYTGTTAVVRHALEWYLEQGVEFEYACLIYATAPLLKLEYLIEGFKMLSDNKPMCFAATKYRFPIERAITITSGGAVSPFSKSHIKMRSQDLSPKYHDTGQFYWAKSNIFMAEACFFSEYSSAVLVPSNHAQDIDDFEDWELAEYLYLSQKATNQIKT